MRSDLIIRDEYIGKLDEYLDSDFVKVFTGIRRCGKTSLLCNIIDILKDRGINEENILFISFEDPEYNLIEDFQELDKIVYSKLKNVIGRVYLFFDEIQQVNSWEKSINGYRFKLDCDIYISGSNSKLLSSELSTLMSGRYIQIKVYPFSFKEILQYKKEIEGVKLTKKSITNLFNNYYLIFGGMPGILTLKSDDFKNSALKDIFNTIILNDVVSRYTIKKVDLLNRFTKYMINSIGQTFSSKSIKNYLKDKNINVSQDTLLKYNNYLQHAYFLLKCRRYDLVGKKEMMIYEKYYLADHGFHNAIVASNRDWKPRILENIVYVELLRRNYEVYVGKIKDKEVDFVCKKNGKKIYIQVTHSITTDETFKREFDPLLKISDKYPAYVLSTEDENYTYEGVQHKNIIDFLISDYI